MAYTLLNIPMRNVYFIFSKIKPETYDVYEELKTATYIPKIKNGGRFEFTITLGFGYFCNYPFENEKVKIRNNYIEMFSRQENKWVIIPKVAKNAKYKIE